ncbi:MAG: XRE family transcriptional regulator [Candidatus Aminicenantes bacterium]|jgi:Zn-dependent peptidase ImmA (M78 family)
MKERIEALVNPKMLEWARKGIGYDIFGAAKKIGIKPERLTDWENGVKKPTIKQAIRMAEVYKRPLSVFYLNEPPKDFSIAMRDFRRIHDSLPGTFSPGLIWEKRQAEMRRNIMIELAEDETEGVFPYLNAIDINQSPEKAAKPIRKLLQIDWETQKKWDSVGKAFNGWKEAIESLNVLVFHTRYQGITFEPEEARGFSISNSRYPVIVINHKDSKAGSIFTLMHEFIHLLLNEGGVCDCLEFYSGSISHERRIEIFCNHVAGSVLIPGEYLMAHQVVKDHGRSPEWDQKEIKKLSSDFYTSDEAVVRRLLINGLTTKKFYEQKRQEYIDRWNEIKRKKKKEMEEEDFRIPYHRLVLYRIGKPFARTVFRAYHDRVITLSDVSDYIGEKVKHFKDLESAAFMNR